MSLRSMTGYGRGQATEHGITVTVEMSGVNRKTLDLVCALPRSLQSLEPRILAVIQERITRGRISLDVSIDYGAASQRQRVQFNHALAAAYVDTLREQARALKLDGSLSLDVLVQLPGVVNVAPPQADLDAVWSVMAQAVRRALRAFEQMRRKEGKALQSDLQARIQLLKSRVTDIRKQAPNVVKQYRTQLGKRLAEAGWQKALQDDRLVRELALFADRSDISEELTRLDSHIKQAMQMTRSRQATGRSLDFMAQEMLREINTVGSKGHDARLLHHVVEFKAELERIREQVQNIE